ncbi:MAG: hypothetical protein KDA88_18665 [Planctomycetaceae bacterium]|nr:hypothetical protein [Planctomycetaceae bacterium]MCB9951332.1 hypothetical protein [Planctomycetaceae bacterium]
MTAFLELSPRITLVPVIHGSGDFAVEIRRLMLQQKFDRVAVPLPPSFARAVEKGIEFLPHVTIVTQDETLPYQEPEWSPDGEAPNETTERQCSFVPIDPCQPVIAALRIAIQERMRREYIDLEVSEFDPKSGLLPDPYALKQTSIDRFAAAILPAITRPVADQQLARIAWMASELRRLDQQEGKTLALCSILDWPWIREAFKGSTPITREPEEVFEPELYRVDPDTLAFVLGELPFITGLYEQARFDLGDDENLSVDGIKELMLSSRETYRNDLKNRARKVTPHLLATILKYVRNLCLVERRMTPDLYTLVTAAKQVLGDQFAISVAETAREYPFRDYLPLPEFRVSVGRGQFPNDDITQLKNRLPGPPVVWRSLELNRKPPKIDQQRWQAQWNPFSHCSWPPEDVAIERFRTHVKDHAMALLGNDLAQVEKFSTSLKDGLDIRETLRNWHTGDLYVKVLPPSRGKLDCVLMFFDSPADPRDYPWRITWHAEHQDESTLAFFSTDYAQDIVGPGIAAATYGGAMFLFPPRPVRDIWRDPRFDMADTLEERLLIAACHHSGENHIAVLSQSAPGQAWKRIAKRFGKRLVHVPLAHFSQETVQQLRIFHVLNGHQVRTYAQHFIRKA